MALQKQFVQLSITDGLDTKTDEKNVVYTRWLAAKNVEYTKTGSVSKRLGFLPYSKRVESADDLASGNAVTSFLDEALLYGGNKLYSFSPGKDRWFDRGYVSNAIATEQNIDVTQTTTFVQSSVSLHGVTCYVYQPSEASASLYIKARLIDDVTGAILAEHTLVAANVVFLKVGTIANSFIIFYRESTSVKFKRIDLADVTTVSAASTVGTNASDYLDCALIGNRLFFAYPSISTGMQIGYIRPDLTALTAFNVSGIFISYATVSQEGINSVRFMYGDKTVLYDYDLTTQLHAPATFNVSGFPADNGASMQDPDNINESYLMWSRSAGTAMPAVRLAKVTNTGTITQLGIIINEACLVSKPQIVNGQVYAIINKKIDSGNLGVRGYFLINKDAQIIGRVATDVGVRKTTQPLVDLSIVSSTSLSFFGAEYYEFFNLTNPSTRTATALKQYTFDFSITNNYFDTLLGRQLHISGAVLYSYDSYKVTEHGFMEIPPAPTYSAVTSISPAIGLDVGDYQYVAVYAWIDAQGQTHRSAPSLPFDYTTVNNTSKLTIEVKPLTLTSKTNVEIEIYRTEANGTVFYKVSSISGVGATENATIINDPTAHEQTFIDAAPDSGIIDKEILYTTGGVLENIAPIASRYATSHKSRVWLLSSDGHKLQFSKLQEENVGIGFYDGFLINFDQFGGMGMALASMDSNLIILKQKALYTLSGEGPDNLGLQNDYKQPNLITSDVGCKDPNSVVSTPMGLMFKSDKGIYLLTRNFELRYVGAPVEGYNSSAITSATLMADLNEVRFTTAAGTCLVYDYFQNRWSTHENLRAVDAMIYDGKFTYLRSDATFMAQSTEFSDNGDYVPMALESAWIQLGGIQGYQRFYKMFILGNYINAHKLRISFAYDFNDTFVDDVIVDCTTLYDNGTYGEGDYGDGIYGGPGNVYQMEVRPKRQKCESFRFKVETIRDGVNGADCTISNFLLIIGSKNTDGKPTKVVGANSK